MSHRGRNLLIVLLALVFCALSAGLVYMAVSLPQITAQKFGRSTLDLSWWEHLYYSVQMLMYEDDLTQPVISGPEPVDISIQYGETAESIAEQLLAQGLIGNTRAFTLYLSYSGLDRTIQAGDYHIEPGLNAIQIAAQIQDATPAEVPFVVLAGWRVEEIAQSLPTSGLQIDPDAFLSVVKIPDLTPARWPQGASLEGIFLPGQYDFPRETTQEEFIRFFIEQFDAVVPAEVSDGFSRQGLDLYEGLTLASIVEKEAVLVDEQPMIASVFLNRLNAGIRLESDPTVQYGLGYNGSQGSWWKNPLTLNDIEFDSTYNTYIYSGLTPGPICSPSLSAMRAVAYPAQTTYLFFRASCDGSGSHRFANTFEEHLANACQEEE